MTRQEQIKALKEYKKRILEYVENIQAFIDEETENRFMPLGGYKENTNSKVKVLKLDYIK